MLCDLEMEDMDGFDLLTRLREHERDDIAGIPVVISTSHSDFTFVQAAAALEISGYLVKPYSTTKLAECITRLLPSLPARETG